MSCRFWREYSKNGAETELRAHLDRCPDCARQVADLELMESCLASMAREQNESLAPPEMESKRELMARLDSSPEKARLRPVIWVPAAGLALALAAIIFVALGPAGQESAGPPSVPVAVVGSFTVLRIDDDNRITETTSLGEVVAPPGSRVLMEMGADRVGLSRGGELEVLGLSEGVVDIRLERGLVACEVASRRGGGRFVITRGEFQVEVVGTRFSVGSDGQHQLVVLVDEGRVKVNGPGGLVELVKAGEALFASPPSILRRSHVPREGLDSMEELLSLPSPSVEKDAGPSVSAKDENRESSPATPDVRALPRKAQHEDISPDKAIEPDFKGWKKMIIAGDHERAHGGLTAYLKQAPRDAQALWLLATCRRKMGNWEGTVEAYERVIGAGGALRRDQARFRIAAIMQDKLGRHEDALVYLNQFLHNAPPLKPLRAEAMTRKGVSLLALGRKAQARSVLESVVREYADRPASAKAKRLLEEMH